MRRIPVGEQYMTVYKAIKPEAQAAASLALALARGEKPKAGFVNGETDDGMKQVPSVLLTPVAVTTDNVADTVVKDGFLKVSDLWHRPLRRRLHDGGRLLERVPTIGERRRSAALRPGGPLVTTSAPAGHRCSPKAKGSDTDA